jgi:hypothetical protein
MLGRELECLKLEQFECLQEKGRQIQGSIKARANNHISLLAALDSTPIFLHQHNSIELFTLKYFS